MFRAQWDSPLKTVFLVLWVLVAIAMVIVSLAFWRCPHCGEYLGRDGRIQYCPHCGKDLDL